MLAVKLTREKILRDHTGLYLTFPKAGVAHRATTLLGSNQLAFQSVTLTVHPPPAYEPVVEKTHWNDDELVTEARKQIIRELRTMLEKDISERVVAIDLKKLVSEERAKTTSLIHQEKKPLESLKGLSFKRAKKAPKEAPVVQKHEPLQEEDEKEEDKEPEPEVGDEEEDEEIVMRPKKKRKTDAVKKKSRRVVEDLDVESEDEVEPPVAPVVESIDAAESRKRAQSEDREEEEEPVKKKSKVQEAKAKKKKGKKAKPVDVVEEVILPESKSFESPVLTKLRLDSVDGSVSPSRSPSPAPPPHRKKRAPTPPPPTPPPDPVALGICDDDEDLYFAKLAITGEVPSEEEPAPPPSTSDIPTFRKHVTGSARTEGYYKITHAEKAAYVAQYQARAANADSAPPVVDEQPQHVTSSRSNRANARRRAQGLEEINQVQRAVALSKGENAASELTFKFNQLQTRKKHLRFARSPIHDWGLYAMEKISRGEMVIEYVGEVIRAQVAEKREKAYERQGIGSSYLFRIDEDLVVDATKKGNLGYVLTISFRSYSDAHIILCYS